jgi:hypothetical protein
MSRREKIPSYRMHRVSGQAVCTIAGRDFYLGPHGTKASKIEYDRLIAEWLASGRLVSFGAFEHALTIAQLLIPDSLRYAKEY